MSQKYINSKQKTNKIKPNLLCLGNISQSIKKKIAVIKMKKKTGLNGYVYNFLLTIILLILVILSIFIII